MATSVVSSETLLADVNQLTSLALNVKADKDCGPECQGEKTLDTLKTKLVETENNCDSYDERQKEYMIQKHGISKYNQIEADKQNALMQKQNEEMTKTFIKKMSETTNKFDILQNDVNNLKLIQEMNDNSGINKPLSDIFGITISSFEKEGFEEKPRTLETVNQEINFSFKKNELGKFINKFFYIIYYILAILVIIYMFVYNKFDIKYRIIISIVIPLLPLLNIVKFVVYLFTMLKSFI